MANTKPLTRSELEAYRARWRRVNDYQIQEMRRMPIALKLRQANTLFRLAKSMNLGSDDLETTAVRARWAKLKQLYEKAKRT